MKIKSLLGSAVVLAGLTAIAPAASANEVEWSASLDFNSEYVFRGFGLGAESIQAGVEAKLGGMTFGAWTSTGIGEESLVNADELDLYIGYGFDISETISGDVGATLYHYPQSGGLFEIGDDEAGTVEIYGGLGFDIPLEPSAYLYYDTTLEVFTAEGSAGYSVPLGDASSLDLSGTIGAVEPDEGDGYTYATLGAAVSYAITEGSSVYFGINSSTASEDNFVDYEDAVAFLTDGTTTVEVDSSTFWYGFGLSTGF